MIARSLRPRRALAAWLVLGGTLGGFLKIERQGTDGTWNDVTMEILGRVDESGVQREMFTDAAGRLHVAGTIRLDELGERIDRAVDKAYAGGIKPMEFGGKDGTAAITKAVLAAL